jgi:hypothetical protein
MICNRRLPKLLFQKREKQWRYSFRLAGQRAFWDRFFLGKRTQAILTQFDQKGSDKSRARDALTLKHTRESHTNSPVAPDKPIRTGEPGFQGDK